MLAEAEAEGETLADGLIDADADADGLMLAEAEADGETDADGLALALGLSDGEGLMLADGDTLAMASHPLNTSKLSKRLSIGPSVASAEYKAMNISSLAPVANRYPAGLPSQTHPNVVSQT